MIGHSGLRFVSYPISKPDPSTGKATINWIAKLNYDPDQTSNREDYFATATRSTNTQWSAATSSAWHTCRIRDALSAPILCTNAETETETETDSTESRFTALRCPIGSSPGSSKTSLGRPRTVVVHGAISPRRSSGIAASRDNTTTGRRPMSGGSHHQSSPRLGRSVMSPLQRSGMKQGRPTRRARRSGGCGRPRRRHHQPLPSDNAAAAPPKPHRSVPHPCFLRVPIERSLGDRDRRQC